jgi:hypothetical protein
VILASPAFIVIEVPEGFLDACPGTLGYMEEDALMFMGYHSTLLLSWQGGYGIGFTGYTL